MLIKNKIVFFIILILVSLSFSFNSNAEELDISAEEIIVENNGKLVIAKGSVVIIDDEGNEVITEKAEYNKLKDQLTTFKSSKIILKNGYDINSGGILYDNKNKVILAQEESNLTDFDGNFISVDMFEYLVEKNLFSSRGNIRIVDVNKNKYFFKEMYIDTKSKKIVGSDIHVALDQTAAGLKKENEPRFAANTAFISKENSNFSNGIFTTCKRRGEKCPPWTLQAKKVNHDMAKKTIYYENAVLKIYDVPIFYFPKFFHPDPTVKRQSGLLTPFFTDKKTVGSGLALPYYWAINNDKDLTFTPKIYTGHKSLFFTEYRQAFKRSYLQLDTSYSQGYSEPSANKMSGSRNHFFGRYDLDFSNDPSYYSKLSLKFERVSNDTYLKIHDINTALVKSENNILNNEINYSYEKDDLYFNISASANEDLNQPNATRYEYFLPNISYGQSLVSSQSFGTLDFRTQAYQNNYNAKTTNKFFINDFIWNSNNLFTEQGFLNSFEAQVKNANYESKNDNDFKSSGGIQELAGVFAFKSRLPMIKESTNYLKTLSPNFMFRYAPGHMRDLSTENVSLSYSNLFTTIKTSEPDVIEKGTTAILGLDYNIEEKKDSENKKKFSLSFGQALSLEDNNDLPSQTSLDQKTSDMVGDAILSFSENNKIEYKFALDHDFNTMNYHEISTALTMGKIDFNLDYLEERNHVGNENYVNTGVTLSLNQSNSLRFQTKKNFRTESTEFYNLIYQYVNDCLAAGIEFNRTFYEDRDIEPSDTIMFKISILPFGGITTPSIYRD